MKVLNDWACLEPISSTGPQQTESGLYLPDNKDTRPATVLGLGAGKYNNDGELLSNPIHRQGVEVGDTVLYNERFSWPVTIGGKQYVMCPPEAIFAKLN